MRRLPRGATVRPPLERPGNGFGRALRPGPSAVTRTLSPAARSYFDDPTGLVDLAAVRGSGSLRGEDVVPRSAILDRTVN